MQSFYFTMGVTEDFPYYGGWVKVYAENRDEAIRKYTKIFGLTSNKNIRCAFIYREIEFKQTRMYKQGNFGAYQHMVIE